MRKNICIVSIFTLVSCGGGGGGSSAPAANLNDNNKPGTTLEPVYSSGFFIDANVTNLRVAQEGEPTTKTSYGNFGYNVNNSSPVCFLIGEVSLGCANPQDYLTPFDLSLPGRPASLQSGYNISRLLLSLDTYPYDQSEIRLSEDSFGAKGVIDFNLSDDQFESDELVSELIEKYGLNKATLATREAVTSHLASNLYAQASIGTLRQALDKDVKNILITWNNLLDQTGVLAHVEVQANISPASSEHWFLEISGRGEKAYLQRITHIDHVGEYTYITLDDEGYPEHINRSGAVYRYLNYMETRIKDFANTSTYRPNRKGYLIGQGGFSDRIETKFVDKAVAEGIAQSLSQFGTQRLEEVDILKLTEYSMMLTQSVRCAQSQESCSSKALDAILLAQSDTVYGSNVLVWNQDVLSNDLCLKDLKSNIKPSGNCSTTPNLADFDRAMQQNFSSYTGMVRPDWYSPVNTHSSYHSMPSTIFAGMLEDFDSEFYVQSTFHCEFYFSFYSFADGFYYVESKPRSGSPTCTRTEDAGSHQCRSHTTGMKSCSDYGVSLPEDWPSDYERDRELTLNVVSRLHQQGYGLLLATSPVTPRHDEKLYLSVEEIERRQQRMSSEMWLQSLIAGRDLSFESFYMTDSARYGNGSDQVVYASLETFSDPGRVYARWHVDFEGEFSNKSGDSIAVKLIKDYSNCTGVNC